MRLDLLVWDWNRAQVVWNGITDKGCDWAEHFFIYRLLTFSENLEIFDLLFKGYVVEIYLNLLKYEPLAQNRISIVSSFVSTGTRD